MVRKSVKLVLLLSMVLLGSTFVLRAEDSVITAAPDDTGPPFVETETYEADMADLQDEITEDDTELQAAIDAEETERIAEDAALWAAIENWMSDLEDETTARASADADLQSQIDDLLFSGAASVVTGNFFGDDAVPVAPYPIEVDLSALGDVAASDVTVTASAFKFDWLHKTYESAFVLWEVTESPLTATLRVYNKSGTEYDQGDVNWAGTELSLSFIAAVSGGGGALPSTSQQIVSGKFEYTVNDFLTMPFEIPITGFEGVDVGLINVVASGVRNETGGKATPLAVKSAVVDSSGLKLNLWVWDIYGNEPDYISSEWSGKTLEVSYAIIGP